MARFMQITLDEQIFDILWKGVVLGNFWDFKENIANILQGLTPKILGPFMPISTSKMLIFSKKSPKKIKKCKNVEILTPKRLWFIRFTKKILSKNIKNPNCDSLPKFLQPTLGFVEF
jgi:hypothetical protein